MFCSKCGKEADPSARFCSSCGGQLAMDAREEPALPESQPGDAVHTDDPPVESAGQESPGKHALAGLITLVAALVALVGLFLPLAVQDPSFGMEIDFGIMDHPNTKGRLLFLLLPIALGYFGLSGLGREQEDDIVWGFIVALIGLLMTLWYGVGASANLKMYAARSLVASDFDYGLGFYLLFLAYLSAAIAWAVIGVRKLRS